MLFKKQERKSKKMMENYHRQQLTEGLFQKCEKCNHIVYTDDVIEHHHVCPRCGRREGESISLERLNELRKKYPDVPVYLDANH